MRRSRLSWCALLAVLALSLSLPLFAAAAAPSAGHAMATFECAGKRLTSEELEDYDIADGGKYIVTVKSNDVLQPTVDDFSKQFGFTPERIFSSLGMFSSALNLEQIQYLLACDNVKFVECDGVVHIAQKRGKDL